MDCQHCQAENPERWFYCRKCGKRASQPLYSPSVIVRHPGFAAAIRKDQIQFTETTMGEDIESKGGVVRGNI